MPSTSIYTLSLHDALPISAGHDVLRDENVALANRLIEAGNSLSLNHYPTAPHGFLEAPAIGAIGEKAIRRSGFWLNQIIEHQPDRKSTRLNSSHQIISYAVHLDLHSFPTRRSSDLGRP